MSEYLKFDEMAEVITQDGALVEWRKITDDNRHDGEGEKKADELKKNTADEVARFVGNFWQFLNWLDGEGVILLYDNARADDWTQLEGNYKRNGGAEIWGDYTADWLRLLVWAHNTARECWEIIARGGEPLFVWNTEEDATSLEVLTDLAEYLEDRDEGERLGDWWHFVGGFWEYLEAVDLDGALLDGEATADEWRALADYYNARGGADAWGWREADDLRTLWEIRKAQA